MSDKPKPQEIARRAQLANALKQEFETKLDERIDRFLRAEHHPLVSNTRFAGASSECIDLFRDGHFYGCISLCQGVGEALLRFMCESNSWRPARDFDENLQILGRRGFVDPTFEENAQRLWERRHDYHHLNPSVASELTELEEIAFSKIRALAEMESWVFAYSVHQGNVRRDRPQYWPRTEDGKLDVFLRFSP